MTDTLAKRLQDFAVLPPREQSRDVSDALMVEAAEYILKLEAEGFEMSAGICEFRGGDEHGNPYCLMVEEGIPRTYPKQLSDKAEYIDGCRCCICELNREYKSLLDRNSQ